MSELKEIQRRMASAVMTPLTRADRMQAKNRDGRSMRTEARQFIKPNDRLSSMERLEIYNQQYWFRILDSFASDFPGLRAIVGASRFEKLSIAYLTDCPSRSFTLRNLGSRLSMWLGKHPEWIQPQERLARDMVRLEWAHIEVFDAAEAPILGPEDLLEVTPATLLDLQPHIRLLQLAYPVDDLLLAVNKDADESGDAASNAGSYQRKQHPAAKKMQRLDPERIYLAVYRHQFLVSFQRLTPEAFRMLRSFQQGNPLGVALDHALRGSRLRESELADPVREWFAEWAQLGWFCKASDTTRLHVGDSSERRQDKI
ncbi:MAG: DNA-binding domain-containing protein [Acidobacteriaceae bacterium]